MNIGQFLASLDFESKPKQAGPHIWRDPYQHRPYRSPLSGREVSSRAERREEMRVHNVREIEPSEGPHRDGSRYRNKEFMRKHGIPEDR